MKKEEKGIDIFTFDSETRGLFGPIFAFGVYDGERYYKLEPLGFIGYLCRMSEERNKRIYAFAHNLDFDFGKLWKLYYGLIDVDWDRSLIINNQVVRIKIIGYDVYLCDSFRLLPSSLEALSKDFELDVKKMDLSEEVARYGSKESYFVNVDENDEKLNEYLKFDCISLYELLMKILVLSELNIEDFIKCPTIASLSMKIYQTLCVEEYKLITEKKLTKILEDFGREAYTGARVEVIKPELGGLTERKTECPRGYHYDINSLYPFVMKDNGFPVGRYEYFDNKLKASYGYAMFKQKRIFKHGLIKARVKVPECAIPVLPYREEKLYFPVGEFEGTWTVEELLLAEKQGAEIEPLEGVFWLKSEYIFKNFVLKMEYEKTHSKGARRNFFKLIQNSLYGKFGMRREREVYMNDSEKNISKLKEKNKEYLEIILTNDKTMLLTKKLVFASYIRPHIAAYVTSYARMYLFEFISHYRDNVYYYDTDSVVLDTELNKKYIHNSKYGAWKCEGEITEGIYLQPKLYAEKLITGEEVLKSKGVLKEKLKDMNFERYRDILNKLKAGEETFKLYDNIPVRRKTISALVKNVDIDEPILACKTLDLKANQKRDMDYVNNCSKPLKFDIKKEEGEV